MTERPGTGRRRAMILVVVLFVITIAALTGAVGKFAADAAVDTAGASLSAARSRALVWSGVQAVMAELSEQRAAVIEGRDPVVTGEWELFKGQGSGRMVVRLLPVNAKGEKFESESAKLDLNTATADMLAKLPGMTADLAKAVVEARGKRPFQSVADLARVKGMGPAPRDEATERGTPPSPSGPARESLLTAFSFEPSIQYGVGPQGSERRGLRRLDVNLGYSAALGEALERRLGSKHTESYKKLLEAAKQIKTRAELLGAARSAGLGAEEWPVLLDQFEAGPDPFLPGRVDVNRAPAEVLACLPGIDAERAARIVQARENTASGARLDMRWLVDQALLTTEQFEQAAGSLTARSFQWRVVIEAGVAPDDEESRARSLTDLTLKSRTVLEAVIDIASERARVAYLRDITLQEAATQIEAAPLRDAPEEKPVEIAESPSGPPPAPPPPPPRPSELPTFGDLHLGSSPAAGPPAPGPPPPPPKLDPVDRRLGRWTAGGAAQGASP